MNKLSDVNKMKEKNFNHMDKNKGKRIIGL